MVKDRVGKSIVNQAIGFGKNIKAFQLLISPRILHAFAFRFLIHLTRIAMGMETTEHESMETKAFVLFCVAFRSCSLDIIMTQMKGH